MVQWGNICQAMDSTPEPQILPRNKKEDAGWFSGCFSMNVGIKPSKPQGLPPTQKPCQAPLQVSHDPPSSQAHISKCSGRK